MKKRKLLSALATTVFIASLFGLIICGALAKMVLFWICFGILMAECAGLLAIQIKCLDWECTKCSHVFSASPKQVLTGINGGNVKKLYCPRCEKKQWCKPVWKNSDNNTD